MKKRSNYSGALLKTAIIATTAIGLVSCKKNAETSEAKSLDNFTADANSFTFNSCSGTNAVTVSDSQLLASPAHKAAIRSTLSAVPVELQSAFFDTLKGTVAVVNDIHSACKTSESEKGLKDATLSCWQTGSTNAIIYIKSEANDADTVRNIKHSVVRAMGYILTDVVLKVKQSSEGTKLVENESFALVKSTLAEALVKDVQANKKLQLPAVYSTNKIAFADGVFAESFDSWYCSSRSRIKMSASFPETYKLFVDVAAELPIGLTAVSSASDKSDSFANSGGFGLWGRWGAGNGPIRQGFSNWGNFRANGGGLFNANRYNNGGGYIFRRPWFNPSRWQ